jgi:hypothetical protein
LAETEIHTIRGVKGYNRNPVGKRGFVLFHPARRLKLRKKTIIRSVRSVEANPSLWNIVNDEAKTLRFGRLG